MSDQIDQFFDWRKRQAAKHRTMTIAEYRGWSRVGDLLSHPSSSNAITGGLTISFAKVEDHIMGKIHNFEQPPTLLNTVNI